MVNYRVPNDVLEYRVKEEDGENNLVHYVLSRPDEKFMVPVLVVSRPNAKQGKVLIWVHPDGKASLTKDGKLVAPAKTVIDAGFTIAAPDVLGVGDNAFSKPPVVDKRYAGYTFGYNRTLLANRVHDVLSVMWFNETLKAKSLSLVGWGEFGPIAVLARALGRSEVTKTAADLNQFRFENIKDTSDPMLLPGAVKYGGMPAFLALCAPGEVLGHNHKGTATGKLPKAAYDAAGAANKLTRHEEKLDDAKVVEWLLKG
jgi:hypothetical protein